MGLNESYATVRGHILLIEPLPSISRAYALILQEERQRSITTPPTIEGIALVAKGNLPPRKDNQYDFQKKERPKCTHCGRDSHTIERCYHLHGFPPTRHKIDNGMQNSLPLSLMQNTNNPKQTTHYSSDPTKVTSQSFLYM
jgi:hypothetical protein